MFEISAQDIRMDLTFASKKAAIHAIGEQMVALGFVEQGYGEGILRREEQTSTFVGYGIAIPHGSIDSRHLVKKTGIVMNYYPDGVCWGNDQKVYLSIGIAAQSDEHLKVLKRLTQILSAQGLEEKIKNIKTKKQLLDLIQQDQQVFPILDESLVHLNFPSTRLLDMQVLVSGMLFDYGGIGHAFLSDMIEQKPLHLGEGLWLVSSSAAVTQTMVAFVRSEATSEQPVQGLLALASANDSHQELINNLVKLIITERLPHLLRVDSFAQFAELLTKRELLQETTDARISRQKADSVLVIEVLNKHGLHTRPSSMLASLARQYTCDIYVSNLDGQVEQINAKSLLKLMTLAASKNHRLEFIANGVDAEAALLAIQDLFLSQFDEV